MGGKSAIEGGGVRCIMAKVMKNNHFFGGENIPKWQCLSLGLSVVANFQSGCSEHLSVIKEACGPTNIWSELQSYKGTNISCMGMTINRKGEGFPEGNLAKWLQTGGWSLDTGSKNQSTSTWVKSVNCWSAIRPTFKESRVTLKWFIHKSRFLSSEESERTKLDILSNRLRNRLIGGKW